MAPVPFSDSLRKVEALPPSVFPDTEVPQPGFLSGNQRRYLAEINKYQIPITDSLQALKSAELVCREVKGRGFFRTVEYLRVEQPDLSEDDATLMTSAAMFTMCANRSPFGESSVPESPLGQGGELAVRMNAVGISISEYQNPVALGRKACELMVSGKSLPAPVSQVMGTARRLDEKYPATAGQRAAPKETDKVTSAFTSGEATSYFVASSVQVLCPAR